MPELIEVEIYRRQAEAVVGRTIADAPVLDPFGLRHDDPDAVRAELQGRTITGTDRVGKLLLLTTDGPTIGLRFGMTGRLLVDGGASIDALEYSSQRDEPAWDRFVLTFTEPDTDLRIRDPRRLGGLELDPDRAQLGPDAATLTAAELADALGTSATSLKARLLDQRRVAGLGNLLVDESLWRAGLAPTRQAGGLGNDDTSVLAETIVATVAELTERGGSHTGDLHEARTPGATCPRDGTPLHRAQVGGRTTYWCPRHQI